MTDDCTARLLSAVISVNSLSRTQLGIVPSWKSAWSSTWKLSMITTGILRAMFSVVFRIHNTRSSFGGHVGLAYHRTVTYSAGNFTASVGSIFGAGIGIA